MSIVEPSPHDYWPQPWNTLFFPQPQGVKRIAKQVVLPDSALRRHFVCYGLTGSGKTTLLEELVICLVARRITGRSPMGVVILDITGDLSRNLRIRFAQMRIKYPELDNLLYLIDPTHSDWSVRFNPCELKHGDTPERLADRLTSGILTLYHDDPQETVRLYRVLKHALLGLIITRRSLPDLPRFLRDRRFREDLVSKARLPRLEEYWLEEFPNRDKEALERSESTLNRLEILNDPDIEEMLRGPNTIDFRNMMDTGAVVLINAPKGKLGEGAAYLLAAFFLFEFQQAALSRIDMVISKRRPFVLLADEYQAYSTKTLLEIAAESRKYRLHIGLVTQGVRGQPKDEALREAVRSVVENIISFRIGYEDAKVISPEVFSPDLDQVKDVRIRYQKVPTLFGEYTKRFEDPVYRSLSEIWEAETRKLTQLPDRWFWWKRRNDPIPHLCETNYVRDVEELGRSFGLRQSLMEQDAAAFRLSGRLKFKRLPVSRQMNLEDSESDGDLALWSY